MKKKKLTKPMRTIRQNYWQKGSEHIIPRWLDTKVIDPKPMKIKLKREFHDTDLDGVPNFQDCNIWNPYEQGWLHDQGARVYNRLRQAKLSRKKRVLAENRADRREPLYLPAGSKEAINKTNRLRRAYETSKRVGGRAKEFTKGAYQAAKQFDPETRVTPGTYFVWVLRTIHDQAGNVVAQDWVDTGERYTSEEQVRQVVTELARRGVNPGEIKIENKPVPKSRQWKEHIQSGLAIKREAGTPVAHVMIHPGPGMVSQPQQQQSSQTRSSLGYSPGFVGATKKHFRVGGDR